ncbi:hypothetical protein ND747_13120 [Frankia sp. R82]|nr:hypothetical protein [Frankia sp. R82]MCM3884588.1 hypothetical protein [Frankia sp. R82]
MPRPRPGAREWCLAWLAEHHPALVGPYRRRYGDGAYAARSYQERIAAQVRELAERAGIGAGAPRSAPRGIGRAAAVGGQHLVVPPRGQLALPGMDG